MSKKILVVEDNPDSRETLVLQLERMGYEVIEAETGKQAVKKALADPPNLIIMDLWLAGMNGIQATTKLKEHAQTAHIPVIAYTASEHRDCKKIALEAGMADFLLKPTPPQVFKDVIEKLLKDRD